MKCVYISVILALGWGWVTNAIVLSQGKGAVMSAVSHGSATSIVHGQTSKISTETNNIGKKQESKIKKNEEKNVLRKEHREKRKEENIKNNMKYKFEIPLKDEIKNQQDRIDYYLSESKKQTMPLAKQRYEDLAYTIFEEQFKNKELLERIKDYKSERRRNEKTKKDDKYQLKKKNEALKQESPLAQGRSLSKEQLEDLKRIDQVHRQAVDAVHEEMKQKNEAFKELRDQTKSHGKFMEYFNPPLDDRPWHKIKNEYYTFKDASHSTFELLRSGKSRGEHSHGDVIKRFVTDKPKSLNIPNAITRVMESDFKSMDKELKAKSTKTSSYQDDIHIPM